MTVPRPSFISQEDLTRVAHALAAGQGQTQLAKEYEWEKNRMRRCVDRIREQVFREGERGGDNARETALEWLRMRGLCTPEELNAAQAIATKPLNPYGVVKPAPRPPVCYFPAKVRALSNERQSHWPANVVGYDIKLNVWARDAAEANSVALEYLRGTEPPSVEFQIEFIKTTFACFLHPKHSFAKQIGPPSWILAAPPKNNPPSLPSTSHRSARRHQQTRRRGGR